MNGNADLPFKEYSRYYDLLYRDKDYAAEAEYVARIIRSAVPAARSILEFGSGTGRHGRLLAGMGFDVHGIERSAEMVSLAMAARMLSDLDGAGAFNCEVGDICKASLGRRFDAVICLFHVISYQTSSLDLNAAFQHAANHLEPDGVFLFDVWHGPAVLAEGPSARVKEVTDGIHRIKREAQPVLDADHNIVKVIYLVECEEVVSGNIFRFEEEHVMRYLFPAEVDLLASACGLQCIATEEFLTGAPPSSLTWGVSYLLRKKR